MKVIGVSEQEWICMHEAERKPYTVLKAKMVRANSWDDSNDTFLLTDYEPSEFFSSFLFILSSSSSSKGLFLWRAIVTIDTIIMVNRPGHTGTPLTNCVTYQQTVSTYNNWESSHRIFTSQSATHTVSASRFDTYHLSLAFFMRLPALYAAKCTLRPIACRAQTLSDCPNSYLRN